MLRCARVPKVLLHSEKLPCNWRAMAPELFGFVAGCELFCSLCRNRAFHNVFWGLVLAGFHERGGLVVARDLFLLRDLGFELWGIGFGTGAGKFNIENIGHGFGALVRRRAIFAARRARYRQSQRNRAGDANETTGDEMIGPASKTNSHGQIVSLLGSEQSAEG